MIFATAIAAGVGGNGFGLAWPRAFGSTGQLKRLHAHSLLLACLIWLGLS